MPPTTAKQAATTATRSYKAGVAYGRSQERRNLYSVQFSAGGDIHAGAGQRKGAECTNTASAGINPFLLPLIELIDRAIDYVAPTELPGIEQVIDEYLYDVITEQEARCLLRLNGASWDAWYPVIRSRRRRLEPKEYVQWRRRHNQPDDETRDNLRSFGYLSATSRAAYMELYDELPNIADHMHWLQRNVFDDDYVRDYGLEDGFETRFWAKFGDQLLAQGYTKERARLQYAAHWINPAPGQLGEMLQRLRPGRVDSALVFTETDYLRILAEQDVAPYFRERFRQIAYRTASIRQMQLLARRHAWDRDEIYQRWQDIGFTAADSAKLADATVIEATRQQVAQAKGFTPQVVAKLWPGGLISRDDAHTYLKPQGLSDDEVDTLLDVSERLYRAQLSATRDRKAINDYASLATKAYGDGIIDKDNAKSALKKAGYSDDAAEVELDTIALGVRRAKINDAVKAIKRAFLSGEINATDAATALTAAGILGYAVADYIGRWTLMLTVPRKVATRAQILGWAREGIISIANAEVRLLNLGWSPDNVALDMLELEATLAQAAAKARAKKIKDLDAASAAAAKVTKQAQAAYCKAYSPSKMIRWYAERIIDESAFRLRLDKCGYSAEATESLFREAEVARAKTDAKAASAGPAGVEYTGPGADTS